jgi:hypothetical protein
VLGWAYYSVTGSSEWDSALINVWNRAETPGGGDELRVSLWTGLCDAVGIAISCDPPAMS